VAICLEATSARPPFADKPVSGRLP
jgi:hypothetical protein